MKIRIEADSQEELDEKRPELIRALAGEHLRVEISKGRHPISPRNSPIKAQNEMIEYWDKKWSETIRDIKKEIEGVLG